MPCSPCWGCCSAAGADIRSAEHRRCGRTEMRQLRIKLYSRDGDMQPIQVMQPIQGHAAGV